MNCHLRCDDYWFGQAVKRGHDAARNEWLLLAACHDFRKLYGKVGVNGLGALATA